MTPFLSREPFEIGLLRQISAQTFAEETQAVESLLEAAAPLAAWEADIAKAARKLAAPLKKPGMRGGVEAFLHEYGLESKEGVAMLCLAEALLRIPDATTADRLIHDTFDEAEWEKHLGGSGSFLVNASSWGLLLTGKVVRLQESQAWPLLAKLAARVGEPVIREALKAGMRFIGRQFVLGETIEEALSHTKPYAQKGYRFSYDMLGEGARSQEQAEGYVESYRHAIEAIGGQVGAGAGFGAPGISIKLSALHPRYQLTQHARVLAELAPRLKDILLLARQHHLSVAIDAEESARFDLALLFFAEVFTDSAFNGWDGLGFVVQAYHKRAVATLDYLATLARRAGRRMPLRLVKGAYWDSEIKAAQVQGLAAYPVFTRKEHTDISYLACAKKILTSMNCFYPQFATHNARTLASIQIMAKKLRIEPGAFEFQRLHGMGEALHDSILGEYQSRIYAPVGTHKDLLAYLIRRLLENSANTSFVNLLMDEATSLDELLKNPVDKLREQPAAIIPLPEHIYPDRKNSQGFDLGNLAACEALQASLQKQSPPAAGAAADEKALSGMIAAAQAAFPSWAQTPVEKRCRIIEDAAELFESHRDAFVALLAKEGGKTIADGLAEVREAADFCRYYASQARTLLAAKALPGYTGESNRLSFVPRGVFACISPWNFPLAIFTGQVVAALVTGNCAIAKPAEQTPTAAALAMKLMHEAGVPKEAFQLAVGSGEKIGQALIKDERIAGVVFTGGTGTARAISRALAAREGALVPFIAETGGVNAMVVDSSALLEQAVDDIIVSAFGSAGQRCSALRLLCVQEDIADDLLALLASAMRELALGDPLDFATDIGPVIDAESKMSLETYIAGIKKSACLIAAAALPEGLTGHFVAPHAFEIKSPRDLTREIFGPVLHVARFKADRQQQLCDDINASGYGLTFGLQSRIEAQVDFFASRIRAGNIYVNRPMTGAVVGVQPFGGEGLSGTGPKAGGPHYLTRFLSERTLTVNTAAIGGNVALLSA